MMHNSIYKNDCMFTASGTHIYLFIQFLLGGAQVSQQHRKVYIYASMIDLCTVDRIGGGVGEESWGEQENSKRINVPAVALTGCRSESR